MIIHATVSITRSTRRYYMNKSSLSMRMECLNDFDNDSAKEYISFLNYHVPNWTSDSKFKKIVGEKSIIYEIKLEDEKVLINLWKNYNQLKSLYKSYEKIRNIFGYFDSTVSEKIYMAYSNAEKYICKSVHPLEEAEILAEHYGSTYKLMKFLLLSHK